MKIFFTLICFTGILLVAKAKDEPVIKVVPPATYASSRFNYEIQLESGFLVDDSIPELVVISDSRSLLRINSGCFDFGAEGLIRQVDYVTFAGQAALQEKFFDKNILKLRKISLNRGVDCFDLEMVAYTTGDWEVLAQMASSFRFVD